MSVVAFEKVSFEFPEGKKVFQEVNFSLDAGKFYYLTGRSGSGKSTLIRLIMADLHPQKGKIKVFDRNFSFFNPKEIALMRQKMGIIFQDFHLLNHLRVIENVAIPLRLRGYSWKEGLLRAHDSLKEVGLEKLVQAYPHDLSGGEQQRVVIARAIVSDPHLILADECTGNLDDDNAHLLLEKLFSYNKKGTTILFATHNRQLIKVNPQPEFHITDENLKLYNPCSFSHFSDAEAFYGVVAS